MKRRPSRKEVQLVLAPALIEALSKLDFDEDGVVLLRVVRALTEIAYDIAAAGCCPRSLMLVQLHRVTRRRLGDLAPSAPVLLMREAKA